MGIGRGAACLGLIVVVGVVARLAAMAPGRDRPMDDPDNYAPLARSIASGGGFAIDGRPTAYRPPLYPLALAAFDRLGRGRFDLGIEVRVLHVVLGVGTILLTWSTARRWGLGTARSLIAAGVVAVDPVLVVQSRSIMTETTAAFLVSASLATLGADVPRRWAAGGALLGLASLCRPSLLPAVGLIAAASATARPIGARALIRSATVALAAAATLAPWAARNEAVLGAPVWTTTHGGYTLALANNPEYYAEVLDGPPNAVWSGPGQRAWQERISRETAGMPEPAADRFLRASALRFMADRPADAARAAAARLGRLWAVAPSPRVYPGPLRLATAAWSAPLLLACAAGVVGRGVRDWPASAATATIAALTVVHALYWTDLRMRAPLIPAVAPLAAAAGFRPKKREFR